MSNAILYWKPIASAPKEPRSPGHHSGPLLRLFIPYSMEAGSPEDCYDVGYWCTYEQCFRFIGDDGPHDMQPTHWCELTFPEMLPDVE